MSAEEWRPVVGAARYQVSSMGSVRSANRVLVAHSRPDPPFYPMVHVRLDDGRKVTKTVHSLVAAAFLGPRPEGLVVRHLDGDATNNSVTNLRYGTHSENLLDQVAHGTHWLAKRTHCNHDHPFDAQNTAYRKSGARICITCDREAKRRHEARRTAARRAHADETAVA